MYLRAVRFGWLCFFSLFLMSAMARAQVGTTLSGTIKGNSGAVAGAKVTVKNLTTGKSAETLANADGEYRFENLAPGDYDVVAVAAGFQTQQSKVTLAARGSQTLNLMMTSSTLSLSDLGFGAAQTQGSPQEQARLNKRSHMLHVHQELGLITTVPLVATVLTGFAAGGRSTSSSTRDLHAALGSTTAVLYGATAYYAIFAPKIPATKTEGPIRLHKALAWIHGPGMVLTPILGAIAFDQKSKGEKVHGIASAHGVVAVTTAIAYGLAIYSVWRPSFPHSQRSGMSVTAETRPLHPVHSSTAKPIYDALDGTAMPGGKEARAELSVSSASRFEGRPQSTHAYAGQNMKSQVTH